MGALLTTNLFEHSRLVYRELYVFLISVLLAEVNALMICSPL